MRVECFVCELFGCEGWDVVDEQLPISQIMNSLRELNQIFFQATRKDAEAFGVTRIQLMALKIVKQNPTISMNELSDRMHSSPSTVSGVVDRLVQAGWIVRERPKRDRRSVVLKLTAEGDQLLELTSERIMSRLTPLMQLPEEDVRHLLRIHGLIVNILQQARED